MSYFFFLCIVFSLDFETGPSWVSLVGFELMILMQTCAFSSHLAWCPLQNHLPHSQPTSFPSSEKKYLIRSLPLQSVWAPYWKGKENFPTFRAQNKDSGNRFHWDSQGCCSQSEISVPVSRIMWQHSPCLFGSVHSLMTGQLSSTDYPCLSVRWH